MPTRSDPPHRRFPAALAAVAVVGLLAAAPGAWVRSTYGAVTSADEPHYLLTALSLAEDGDLDISDELAEERWRTFHEAALPRQSAELPDGRHVAPHDPLLPVLLALPMGIGGWLAARLALAIVAGALAAATLWLAVRRFEVPLGVATATVASAAASVPLFVYGSQVYPELPAALAVTLAAGAGLGPVRPRSSVVVALAVVALPWLAVKYVPVAATLALLHLMRVHRTDRRHVAGLLGGYAVAGATYVMAHLAWYGGVTVYAAGDFFLEHGGQSAVFGTRPNLPGRSVRLIGLLVDRGFGIAAWQPAWLAVVPAAAALLRRRPARWTWLLLPLAVGWLNATFVAVTMHGWWFPGRQVVHVLPLAVVAIAWWVARQARAVQGVVAAAAALGAWSSAWLITEGLRGRIAWIVDFAAVADPWYRIWRTVLPDHLAATPATWWLHAVWVAALVLVAVLAWRRAGRVQPPYDPTSSEEIPSAS